MSVEFVRPTEEHLLELSRSMRAADTDECMALGFQPLEALRGSLGASTHCLAALMSGGEVMAVGGIALAPTGSVIGPRVAQAWILTSRLVTLRPIAFHKAVKAWIQWAEQEADILWNWVDSRYTASLRWLARLEFAVGPPVSVGPFGLPFCFCVRRSEPWA